MNLNEYQALCLRTASFYDEQPTVGLTPETSVSYSTLIAVMGLAGESGEMVDMLKKVIGQGHPFHANKARMAEELGDCLWYASLCAHALGLTLDEVASSNIEKLRRRYPHEFTVERSLRRDTE